MHVIYQLISLYVCLIGDVRHAEHLTSLHDVHYTGGVGYDELITDLIVEDLSDPRFGEPVDLGQESIGVILQIDDEYGLLCGIVGLVISQLHLMGQLIR